MKVTPRRWQVDAFKKWIAASRHGIVEVITGGGKTIFAQYCIEDFLAASSQPSAILILVPTHALLDQWYVSLLEDVGVNPDQVGLWSGKASPPNAYSGQAEAHLAVSRGASRTKPRAFGA